MSALHLSALRTGIEIVGEKGSARFRKSSRPQENTRDIPAGKRPYKWEIVWKNVVAFAILHAIALHGTYLVITQMKLGLLVYACGYGMAVSQGITAGAHRLWAHRSYKAKLPLKLILLFLQTTAFQNSVFVWVRDHRLHHKFTDTDADPHNAKRGFFYSHMGWLFLKKQNELKEKGKTIDMDDIKTDGLLMWQHRHYGLLMLVCCFIIPTLIPWYFWREDYYTSFAVAGALRYVYSVHATWLVNSAAHIYGMKPYDKNIGPTENKLVSYMACGEGFHNYHHTFPWDYKAAELGDYSLNVTLAILDFFGRIGWAYDMKTVSEEVIKKRALRTGDGSRKGHRKGMEVPAGGIQQGLVWGWGDADISKEDAEAALILHEEKKC